MNKTLGFLFVFLLLPSLLAVDVGFVVKDSGNPSSYSVITNSITSLGYSYELIDDSQINNVNWNNYQMILVWEETLSNVNSIPIKQKKSLVANHYYVENWGVADYANCIGSNNYEYGNILVNNQITEEVTNPIKFYTSTIPVTCVLPYNYKERASGLSKIITSNTNDRVIVGTINKNGALYSGGVAGDKIVFFGATETNYWTSSTERLFKNSIRWLIGEDKDGDGYFTPQDCNDNDASIHPGANDVFKNCINDKPIIFSMNKVITEESETAEIVVDAIDPEGDELTYSINDNRFEQDGNTFYWETDYGDEGVYYFTVIVSDGEFSDSIEVEVDVRDKNQAPVCANIPALQFNEDQSLSIDLNDYCSDAEGDPLEFSVYDSSEDIYFDGNISASENWNGNGWIIFSVTDGCDEILTNKVSVKVNPINDKPILINYSPRGVLRILENAEQLLYANFLDIDGDDLHLTWFLDGKELDNAEEEYEFSSGEKGTYELEVVASDGEFEESHTWNIFVGEPSDFTCSDIGGFVFEKNQRCTGEIIGVRDTNYCCSIEPELGFNDINRCSVKNSEVTIDFKDISENDEFDVGETMNFRVKVKNYLEDSIDADVEVYLYDLTADAVVEEYDDSVSLDENEESIVSFEIKIPEDLDEDDGYALFAKVKDEECNEKYIKVDIQREDHNLIIDSFKFNNEFSCGDFVLIETLVKNLGSEDESAYITITNSELGINERQNFDIEKFDDKDEVKSNFQIKLPEDAEGEYELRANVYFQGGNNYVTAPLNVYCKKVNQEAIETNELALISSNTEVGDKTNISGLLIGGIIVTVILLAGFLVMLFLTLNKKD
ncbi:MAG: hypothetical protein WC438_00190 [Candidatus Pacearchaeota archaeon]